MAHGYSSWEGGPPCRCLLNGMNTPCAAVALCFVRYVLCQCYPAHLVCIAPRSPLDNPAKCLSCFSYHSNRMLSVLLSLSSAGHAVSVEACGQ